MATSQACFKWTDEKFINLIKWLQEFKISMEFRNCDSNANTFKLYESVTEGHCKFWYHINKQWLFVFDKSNAR